MRRCRHIASGNHLRSNGADVRGQASSTPPSQSFSLGVWEVPVLVLAIAWLAFELAIFRDASFSKPLSYVAIMFAIGAVYLAYLLVCCGGARGLKMPELTAIDAILDADRGAELAPTPAE